MRGEIDSYQLEKRYLHKDGHVVWVNLTPRCNATKPAIRPTASPSSRISSASVPSGQERDAAATHRENAPFPIMVHAEDGEVVHLSQAWLDLTGYAREEIGTIAAWTERAYGERKEVVRDHRPALRARSGGRRGRVPHPHRRRPDARLDILALRHSGAMTAAGGWW